MSADFQLPEDPGEFQAWLDNFAEKLPLFAEQLGITPEKLAQVQQFKLEHRKQVHQAVTEALLIQRQRLAAVCPKEQWPKVFEDGWMRLPITREPERSRCARLLAQWITGIERAHAGPVRPELRCSYFEQGIRVEFTKPLPCDMTSVYYRQRGRATWQLLGIYASGSKYLHTAPEYLEEAEQKLWPGRVLEFVAVGRFEAASFGFPSEIAFAKVPEKYPVLMPD